MDVAIKTCGSESRSRRRSSKRRPDGIKIRTREYFTTGTNALKI